MAIKTFEINLNGGDAVTADNDLTYKIYGSADGYTTAIHTAGSHVTDADVTVAAGVTTIVNVDVGAETQYRVTTIDEALNESDKSDVFGLEFKLKFISANLEYLSFPTKVFAGDFYVEMKINTPTDVLNELIATSSGSAKINIATVGRMQCFANTGGAQTPLTDTYSRQPYTGVILKFQRVGNDVLGYEDGVLKYTWLGLTDSFNFGRIARFSTGYGDVEFEWLDINGEMFDYNEGAGNITTGSLGTIMTLNSSVSTDAMWVEI